MGRKSVYQLERQLAAAKRREDYYRDRVPPESGTVQQRDATTLYYRSLNIKSGENHSVFKVSVGNEDLSQIGGAAAVGLLEDPPANTSVLGAKNNVKPSRIHWYKGASTPVAGTSPWGTRTTRYYDKVGDRSHFSVPVSKATGVIAASDIQAVFSGLFGGTGTKNSLLGTKNGQAWLSLEEYTISYAT